MPVNATLQLCSQRIQGRITKGFKNKGVFLPEDFDDSSGIGSYSWID